MKIPDQFLNELLIAHKEASKCPPPELVISFFNDLLSVLFPELTRDRLQDKDAIKNRLQELKDRFRTILNHNTECVNSNRKGIEGQFFDTLPDLHTRLLKDVEATFRGDPAAKNRAEVVRTYPGFYAISAYRIAHQLFRMGINLIPRIISEHAHGETGIDIHPGAKIGESLCIDHGTGIVIGETTEIGNHVKIYQGVTLGGLSVKKEDASIKRHPTIKDNVVIYAGATILGGTTVIGENSTIGGNVWLTRSVPPNSKVYYKAKMSNSEGETDTVIFN